MHVRRLIGSLLATTLAATTLVAVATTAPASAATPVTIISGTSGKPWIYPSSYRSQRGAPVAGSSLSVSVNVTAPGVETVYAGTVAVQRLVPGSSWKTVLTSANAYLYDTLKVVSNAQYRVVYSGGTNYQGSFDPAVSAGKTIKAQRKLTTSTLSGRKAGFKGKISPKKKVKIVVLKKQGKKYKKFKTLRTSKKGRFTVVLPAPRRGKFFWKIIFKGDKKFQPSTIKGNTYKY